MRLALIVSFLLAGGACLLFFLSFERRKPSVKDILPVVVMVAAASAGRVVFNFLPQIQPVTAVVIIMGVYCGKQAGFLTGALSALVSNLFLGQGPWTPFQMLAWGLTGVLAAVLAKAPFFRRTWAVCVYGLTAGFLYGAVTDVWTVMAMGESLSGSLLFAAYAAAVPFNAIHGVGNMVFLLLLYRPLGSKLKRIQEKFGALIPAEADKGETTGDEPKGAENV